MRKSAKKPVTPAGAAPARAAAVASRGRVGKKKKGAAAAPARASAVEEIPRTQSKRFLMRSGCLRVGNDALDISDKRCNDLILKLVASDLAIASDAGRSTIKTRDTVRTFESNDIHIY